ncbi:MAG: hypothetical protein HQ564_07745 [Candidatus Saganbacteria bacterium]|nr:hypothetical protein [Candidatus Saganbacteria bacterium]
MGGFVELLQSIDTWYSKRSVKQKKKAPQKRLPGLAACGPIKNENPFCPKGSYSDDYGDYISLRSKGKCCTQGDKGGYLCIEKVTEGTLGKKKNPLVSDGKYFWSTEWDSSKKGYILYKTDKDSKQIASFFLGKKQVHDLAWDGKHLWATVSENLNSEKIYKISTQGQILDSITFKSSTILHGNRGVAWDGNSLWTTQGHTIYNIDLKGNIITSFLSPSSESHNLSWDGKYFWNLDWGEAHGKSPRFYQLSKEGKVINRFYTPTRLSPDGIFYDDKHFWHSDTARTFKLSLTK